MSTRIDGTNASATSTQKNQALVHELVTQGSFTEGAGVADDDSKSSGGGSKGASAGKGGAKTNNAAKLTAPKEKTADTTQLERSLTPSASSGASAGGSLSIGNDAPATRVAHGQDEDVRALATQSDASSVAKDLVSKAAGTAAETDAAKPRVLDADPRVAAAQIKLAQDMADPSVSDEQIQRDVQNLIDVTKAQGRGGEALKVLTNAMPSNTTAKRSASIYEMAAKAGVSLDDNASKSKAAVADANVAKAQRAMEKAKQEAAQQTAQKAAGGGGGGSSGTAKGAGGGGGGSGGPSSWDGKKAAASTKTTDTSSAGGSKMDYSGPAESFPNDSSKWASWDDLWSKAAGQMAGANSAEQTAWVKEGIEAEAAKTGIDPRFILAMVMQESGGNVNVHTTNNGVNNPGLMQSHNGVSFDGSKASVLQMIQDGVQGTSSGDGLVQGLQKTGNLFAAARMYNSGQMDSSNLSNAMGATASYCSDLANFVMGR